MEADWFRVFRPGPHPRTEPETPKSQEGASWKVAFFLGDCTPYTPHPTPYTLNLTPHTLHPGGSSWKVAFFLGDRASIPPRPSKPTVVVDGSANVFFIT